MSTAILTAPPVPTHAPARTLAEILNEQISAQDPNSPLDALDRCDQCGAAAKSVFHFPNAEDPDRDNELMFCGRHTRQRIEAILNANPRSYWVDPAELWSIKGVNVPKQDLTRAGDGLTDASN